MTDHQSNSERNNMAARSSRAQKPNPFLFSRFSDPIPYDVTIPEHRLRSEDIDKRNELFAQILEQQRKVIEPLYKKFIAKNRKVNSGREFEEKLVEFLNTLLKDRFRLDVKWEETPLEKIDFPQISDSDWIPKKAHAAVEVFCEVLVGYYNAPIIVDNLNTKHVQGLTEHPETLFFDAPHSERRSDRLTISYVINETFLTFLEKSKLRKAVIFTLMNLAESVTKRIQAQPMTRKGQMLISLFESVQAMFDVVAEEGTYRSQDYHNWPQWAQIYVAETINERFDTFIAQMKWIYESSEEDLSLYDAKSPRE